MFLWPKFLKVTCKFEAINWKTAPGFNQVLSLWVNCINKTKGLLNILLCYGLRHLMEALDRARRISNPDILFSLGQIPVRTKNYSDTVVLYYYVHGVIHQGQNYDISYFSLILNLKIITIIIINYYNTTLTKECEDITPFPS